jgi:hypothetical protein
MQGMRAPLLATSRIERQLEDSFVVQAPKLCRSSAITTIITIKPAGMTIGGTNHLAITGPPEKCTSASASFEHHLYAGMMPCASLT